MRLADIDAWILWIAVRKRVERRLVIALVPQLSINLCLYETANLRNSVESVDI